jgi:hypothetical protein
MAFTWAFWLVMVALVVAQAVCGVVLGGNWRPWYRKSENPRGFWTVIAIQSVMLLALALGWILIHESERHRG